MNTAQESTLQECYLSDLLRTLAFYVCVIQQPTPKFFCVLGFLFGSS